LYNSSGKNRKLNQKTPKIEEFVSCPVKSQFEMHTSKFEEKFRKTNEIFEHKKDSNLKLNVIEKIALCD